MTQSRVKIQVIIETVSQDGKLTKADQWDVINACTLATLAAIEKYVSPSQRQHACDAVALVMRGPLPQSVKYGATVIESPFEEEEESL